MLGVCRTILAVAMFFLMEYVSENIAKDHSFFKFFEDAPLKKRKWCQLVLNVVACTVFMLITQWYKPCIVWYVLTLVSTALYKWIENDRYNEDEHYDQN